MRSSYDAVGWKWKRADGVKTVRDEMLLLLSGCVEGEREKLEGLARKEDDELLVGKEERRKDAEDRTSV